VPLLARSLELELVRPDGSQERVELMLDSESYTVPRRSHVVRVNRHDDDERRNDREDDDDESSTPNNLFGSAPIDDQGRDTQGNGEDE
jgi:hypothetical protein